MIKLKDGMWQVLSVTISLFVTIAQIFILSKNLTSMELGILSLATIPILISNIISDFGIGNYIVHKKNLALEQLSALFGLTVVLSVIAIVVLTLIGSFLSYFYNQDIIFYITLVSSVSIVFSCLSVVSYSIAVSNHNFEVVSKSEIINKVILIISIVVLFKLGLGVYSLPIAQAIAFASKMIYLFSWTKSIGKLPKYKSLFDFNCILGAVPFGLSQVGSQVVNVIGQKTDELLIGYFIGINELGVYSVIKQILNACNGLVSVPIRKLLMPVFRELDFNNYSFLKAYNFYVSLIFLTFSLVFISSGIISTLLPVLNGFDIELSVLVVAWFFRLSAGNLQTALLVSKGKPEEELKWNVVQTIFISISLVVALSIFELRTLISVSILILSLNLMMVSYSVIFFSGKFFLGIRRFIALSNVLALFLWSLVYFLAPNFVVLTIVFIGVLMVLYTYKKLYD
ncbi:Teichuronic acid biosynthesis protein TuaB [Shewanella sp. P1-14-1]|uniref:oligosaccharide flippase family protein n=1 Tax=Shewanella sp. P1-14-1 TaxID=1723761 RepID=UPI0006D684C7|nr:oligosaccharide flippase family protein [Shewanella sp. P1-14-1]KPZ72997.1 Teichuronic acid biosynthesis protein TuaB [Shewanella sp. P1-14-1]